MPIEHLPESMKPAARSFRDWFITDKGALLILTLVFSVRSSTYLFQDGWLLPHILDSQVPLVSSLWWVATTLVVAACTFIPGKKADLVGLVVAMVMLVTWGILFAWTGWAEFTARGVLYFGLATMSWYTIWRGHAKELRMR